MISFNHSVYITRPLWFQCWQFIKIAWNAQVIWHICEHFNSSLCRFTFLILKKDFLTSKIGLNLTKWSGSKIAVTKKISRLFLLFSFQSYISFHSYGQKILYPWSYTSARIEDWYDLQQMGEIMAKEIRKTSGDYYR